MKRALPAVGLFFLAPLVAEFLLGNMPVTMLGTMIVLAPMYGGGALLIREVVRRSGRGWPTILLLGIAFGIVEEAFLTQSLFNPDYLGLNLHLLQAAYIPALGIGAWWTVFVLTLHTVWSISVSIALTEALVPERADQPWLGKAGLSIDAGLFVVASIAIASFTVKADRNHFVASRSQFAVSAVVCLAIMLAAFLWRGGKRLRTRGYVPSPWMVGGVALVLSSVFLVSPDAWKWWSGRATPDQLGWGSVALYCGLFAATGALISVWSGRSGWDGRHRLALAAGAAATYAWHAFLQKPSVGSAGMSARMGNVVFALGLVLLVAIAARRNARTVALAAAQR